MIGDHHFPDVVVVTDGNDEIELAKDVLIDGRSFWIPAGTRVVVSAGDSEATTLRIEMMTRSVRFVPATEAWTVELAEQACHAAQAALTAAQISLSDAITAAEADS